jgi:hypothetical protein
MRQPTYGKEVLLPAIFTCVICGAAFRSEGAARKPIQTYQGRWLARLATLRPGISECRIQGDV